jgi:hypothetical protein
MQVINGWCPMVLGMPTECGEAHANIEPRDLINKRMVNFSKEIKYIGVSVS